MADFPILMNDAIAQATWEGRKTATVRPLGQFKTLKPGDRLWVRECFRCYGGDEYMYLRDPVQIIHRANLIDPGQYHFRPSIHMPRWAARTVVTVTQVAECRLLSLPLMWAQDEGFATWVAFRAAVRTTYPGITDNTVVRCIRWAPFDKSHPLPDVPHA